MEDLTFPEKKGKRGVMWGGVRERDWEEKLQEGWKVNKLIKKNKRYSAIINNAMMKFAHTLM